jgi:hypothetical protein
MKTLLIMSATAITLSLAAPAFAESGEPTCGAAKGTWMSKSAAKQKVAAMGYDARKVKREGNCYEVYAVSNNGGRFELFINPVTGKLVATKRK